PLPLSVLRCPNALPHFPTRRSSDLERLAALPGITGVWQVHGRCRVRFEEMMRMDIDYVRRCSFWLDLNILLLTIPAVISGRGAEDRKSTRLNSSHVSISYAVFCLKK